MPPGSAGANGARLNTSAPTFVPKRVTMKNKRLAEEKKERLQKATEEQKRRNEEKERVRKEDERKQREQEEKVKEQAGPKGGEFVGNEPSSDDHAAQSEQAARLKREVLRLDPSLSSDAKRRPGLLDLSTTTIVSIPHSALASARIIEDLGNVPYPDGIMSPKPELNVNAKKGKFRYDRDFLLQFMAICKEKPESLPPLDAIGWELTYWHQQFAMTRASGSGR